MAVGGRAGNDHHDDLNRMCTRLARIAAIRRQDPLIRSHDPRASHVEGAVSGPGTGLYEGAASRDFIRPADLEAMEDVSSTPPASSCRIVTLAPEHDPGLKVTRLTLAGQKVQRLRRALQSEPRPATRGDRCGAVDVYAPGQRLPDALAPPRQHHPAGCSAWRTTFGSGSLATAFIYLTPRWRITCAQRRQTARSSSATVSPPPA